MKLQTSHPFIVLARNFLSLTTVVIVVVSFKSMGIVEFKAIPKGLHTLNLKDNPDAAIILVNDTELQYGAPSSHYTHVTTVCDYYKGYTKKQIEQATKARCLMGMIGSPSECDFQRLVHNNLLHDCPITNHNITTAHAIFGPNLANISGKTVRRKPEQVETDYVEIPCGIIKINLQVTFVADVMFVNGVAFLVPGLPNINLITIEHAPQRTAPKLGYLLQPITRVYGRVGFTIQTILMDNEFEKVEDHLPMAALNTPAAVEHVGEIKRHVRIIKERTRGIICTLPYPRLIPQQMPIHLLDFVVMWLNNFPIMDGISDHFSPRELIFCHRLDYKHHCCTPFGAYCETHEDNAQLTNSMKTQGTPVICLGPTGNLQGTYNFLNLVTGLVIKYADLTNYLHRILSLPALLPSLERRAYLPTFLRIVIASRMIDLTTQRQQPDLTLLLLWFIHTFLLKCPGLDLSIICSLLLTPLPFPGVNLIGRHWLMKQQKMQILI